MCPILSGNSSLAVYGNFSVVMNLGSICHKKMEESSGCPLLMVDIDISYVNDTDGEGKEKFGFEDYCEILQKGEEYFNLYIALSKCPPLRQS